MSARKRWR